MAELISAGICHRFGRHVVLKGVDLAAGPGSCSVLFGSNGSGKSTLLAILATRLRLQRGRYRLNGIEAGNGQDDAIRGQLLLAGHATQLYGHLTALENLRFFVDLRGLRLDDAPLQRVIEEAGLIRFIHRPVRGFSAGMRKRLALGRMRLAQPALLLLDEPYSALDAEGIAWLNRMLLEYLADGGMVVMASHAPERVAALPHVSYRLTDGRLTREGAHDPAQSAAQSAAQVVAQVAAGTAEAENPSC